MDTRLATDRLYCPLAFQVSKGPHLIKKGVTMRKTYDRRFFAPLGFLFFLGFLGFLGTTNYRHLAALAAPAGLASLAALIFIPRNENDVPPQYRLSSHADILRALQGKV